MIGSPRMRSVPSLQRPSAKDIEHCCGYSVRINGSIGYCKRHSPFITPQHMGWVRYLLVSGKIVVGIVCPFIIKLLLVAAFVLIFLQVAIIAVERQGLVACLKLQTFAQTYQDFYISEYEKARCDDLGVIVDAPVRLFDD